MLLSKWNIALDFVILHSRRLESSIVFVGSIRCLTAFGYLKYVDGFAQLSFMGFQIFGYFLVYFLLQCSSSAKANFSVSVA